MFGRSLATNFDSWSTSSMELLPRLLRLSVDKKFLDTHLRLSTIATHEESNPNYKPKVLDTRKIPTKDILVAENPTGEIAFFISNDNTYYGIIGSRYVFPYFGLTGTAKGLVIGKNIIPLPGGRNRYGGNFGEDPQDQPIWNLQTSIIMSEKRESTLKTLHTYSNTIISWQQLVQMAASANQT